VPVTAAPILTAPPTSAVAATPTAAPASPSASGCNQDQIASLQTELSTNIYELAAQATQNATVGSSVTNTNKGKVYAANANLKLNFILEGLDHPALVALSNSAVATAKSLGATMEVAGGDGTAATQVSLLEAALASGTDGVLIEPATTVGLQSVLAQYDAKGVPYVFALKGMPGVNDASQVIAPYPIEGTEIGQYLVKHYANDPGPINVAIIDGITGDASSVARIDSLKIQLLAACKFNIVAEQAGQYRRAASETAMEGMLAAHPDIQLLVGANDEAALGGLDALKAAGITGVTVAGMDGEKDMFTCIKAGDCLVSITHLTPADGLNASTVLINYLQGKPVPNYVVQVGQIVDASNVDTLTPSF
jgi:ribose transport system substrate-binding protein